METPTKNAPLLRDDAFFQKLAVHRVELAKTPELWQFTPLSASALATLARNLGLHAYSQDVVEKLWSVGLLRADRVRSNIKLPDDGMQLLSEQQGVFTYFDGRPIPYRDSGYGGSFGQLQFDQNGLELSFHPFRVFVLHHIDRVFHLDISPYQYLFYPGGYERVVREVVAFTDGWTRTQQFRERFEDWNRTAELALGLEPGWYQDVFGTVTWRYPDTEETIIERLAKTREAIKNIIASIDSSAIHEVRQELCTSGEIIDDNKLLHVLLRLMSSHERLKLRSGLGLCMHFLAMAEIIRRAFESATGNVLPEEDELGFGQWMDGARKAIFGADRILDASEEVRRDFLRTMGLDGGTKTRCYAEGATELGALRSAVGEGAGIAIINLSGQVIEARGRGLAFADSLKTDLNSNVFSVVLIDGDRSDEIRVLKKAAQNEEFFGVFFIAEPDLEFGNFTRDELIEVAINYGTTARELTINEPQWRVAALNAKSGKELESAWKQCGYGTLKGESWGIALMNFALNNRQFPSCHPQSGQLRPIVEAARVLAQSRSAGYMRSKDLWRVDCTTGKLVHRQ